jgi:hypothetical protein
MVSRAQFGWFKWRSYLDARSDLHFERHAIDELGGVDDVGLTVG